MLAFCFIRLGCRTVLFAAAIAAYVSARLHPGGPSLMGNPTVNRIVWLLFLLGILSRFFPSRLESRGCEKVFARNYLPTGKTVPRGSAPNARGAALTLAVWLTLNAAIGALHLTGVLDRGAMLLICSFFSVCDDVCILFYCPFQSLLMKNRCCVTCRIFSWDYAMMFTPLLFVPGVCFRSLLFLSLALAVRWEITYRLHPERFSEETNRYLSCAGCTERLCRYKRRRAGGGGR